MSYNFKKNTTTVKFLLLMLLVIIILTGSAGCGTNQRKSEAEASSGKIKIVDCIGREVEIPKKTQKIACLYAFAGHVTILLGEEEKIVAVVGGLKRDNLVTSMYPEISKMPSPFSDGSINMEELVKLNPDVVFIRETTAQNPSEMEKLKALDIPAVVVDSNSIEQQRESVLLIGRICGAKAEEKAKKYDEIYQRAIDFATSKKADIKQSEKVMVFHSVNEATRTDFTGSLPAQWTEMVGVLNVSVNKELEAFEGKTYAGLEQIYLWDPDMIICNEPGVDGYILTNEKWKGLKAVKNNRVYQMPIAISRWGHPGSMETPLAIYWLGKMAYPERYKEIDLEEETRNFYKYFFQYDLSDAQIKEILSGKGMRKDKE